jgi:heterodisulfide reductase subunit A
MTEKPKIGVYICWCGTNIAKMVDVEAVAESMRKMPNVAISRNYKYMCSDPGQDLIIKDIKELNLNRIVVAACSPRIHELTFRKALHNAGLNPYLFEMANIREQDSWVHTDRFEATRKAKALVAAAVNRVSFHESLDERSVEINPATLVIGGGIAGISAALEIADAGKKVYLVENTSRLGGQAAQIDLTFPFLDSARQVIRPMISRVKSNPDIEIFLETEIKEIFGYVGNFETTVTNELRQKTRLKFGHVIIATGLKPWDPSSIDFYGYGRLPDVITSVEFEKMLMSGNILKKNGKVPSNIAIIHCVGSRNKKYHEYCSRICCMVALKYANQIRSALPSASIYDLYADMRAMSKGGEELYAATSRKNVMFLMFDQHDGLPFIRKSNSGEPADMIIEMNEKLSGERVELAVDMVILMVNMEARENARELARTAGLSLCGNQFYIEKHPKLDPVATTTNGVFIVGSCQGPKDIPDSISQARAAAARVLASIVKGTVHVEVTTSHVNEEICCGCETCIAVCPYSAITFNSELNISQVNEILCKGCGTCGSTCPTGAVRSRHFTDQQISSEIEGIMAMSHEF